jgi:3-methylfumaryl-CoA hydratase
MVFVTVGHRLSTPRGLAIEEEQDIVYMPMPARFAPPPPVPAPAEPAWREDVPIDTVRASSASRRRPSTRTASTTTSPTRPRSRSTPASSCTARSRRSCSWRPPGGGRATPRPQRFRFRGVHPLFHTDRLALVGDGPVDGAEALATVNGAGHVCMQASVTWRG